LLHFPEQPAELLTLLTSRLPRVVLRAARLTPRLLLPHAALRAALPTLTRSKINFATPDSQEIRLSLSKYHRRIPL